MDWAYPGHGNISKKNRKLFKAWDKEDPVNAWECELAWKEQAFLRETLSVKAVCKAGGEEATQASAAPVLLRLLTDQSSSP